MALLHALYQLRMEGRFELVVAHLNHLARGRESNEDARFVESLAHSLGLPFIEERRDVNDEKKQLKTSFQESGRILRYRFLESARIQEKAQKIAIGHTADDQVETFFMNLLRGSGSKGLGGIPPVRERIIRPLIDCSRDEIEAFLDQSHLDFRLDSSNQKNDYLRNRVRSNLIPFLQIEYNPKLKSTILETVNILREEDRYLDESARQHLNRCGGRTSESDGFFLNISSFLRISPSLQKRLVRQAVFAVKNDLRKVTAKHIQDVIELFSEGSSGKSVHLPGPIEVKNVGNNIEFHRIKNPPGLSNILNMHNPDSGATCLNIPGETRLPGTSLKFVAQVLGQNRLNVAEAHANQAFLDFDKTGKSIHARYFIPGDRFVPLGMTGKKKLKSFLIDEKVPQEERKSIPVLTTGNDDIIWVYGKRISHSHRVTPETRTILFIEGVNG